MCPDGVPMVALGEIGSLIRGNGLQKKDFVDHGVGCIHYGQIYTRFGLFTNKTLAYVSESLANKLTPVESGNLVIACTSENVEDVCKCVAWLGDQTIVTGGHAVVFKHSQDPKYIAYCFTSEDFQIQKRKYAFGAKVIDIKIDKLASIQIPLPPLPIQQRIVEILDKFTSLVSSLDSEIALRQKQYEYYRNKLLSFEEGLSTIKLKDITSKIASGATPSGGDRAYKESGISLIRSQNVLDHSFSKEGLVFIDKEQADNLSNVEIKEGDLLINITGDSVARACKVPSDLIPSRTNQHVAIIRINNDEIDSDFILYELNSRKEELIQIATANGGSRKALSKGILEKLDIYFPPLPVQLSIVRTLDTFESLLTNLKKERELRQKQYEYYREKLLTFA